MSTSGNTTNQHLLMQCIVTTLEPASSGHHGYCTVLLWFPVSLIQRSLCSDSNPIFADIILFKESEHFQMSHSLDVKELSHLTPTPK